MGSGARARSRSFKPRDNFAVEESHRASTSPPGETSGGGAASLAAARLSFGQGASSDGIRGSGLGTAASVVGEPCRACRAAGASTSGTHGGGATGRSPPRRSSELARALAADARVAVPIDHPHAVADDGEPGGDAQPRCTCGRGWNERVRRLSETLAQGLVAAAVPATRGAHDATNERIESESESGWPGGGGVGDSPTGDDDILLYDGGDEGARGRRRPRRRRRAAKSESSRATRVQSESSVSRASYPVRRVSVVRRSMRRPELRDVRRPPRISNRGRRGVARWILPHGAPGGGGGGGGHRDGGGGEPSTNGMGSKRRAERRRRRAKPGDGPADCRG